MSINPRLTWNVYSADVHDVCRKWFWSSYDLRIKMLRSSILAMFSVIKSLCSSDYIGEQCVVHSLNYFFVPHFYMFSPVESVSTLTYMHTRWFRCVHDMCVLNSSVGNMCQAWHMYGTFCFVTFHHSQLINKPSSWLDYMYDTKFCVAQSFDPCCVALHLLKTCRILPFYRLKMCILPFAVVLFIPQGIFLFYNIKRPIINFYISQSYPIEHSISVFLLNLQLHKQVLFILQAYQFLSFWSQILVFLQFTCSKKPCLCSNTEGIAPLYRYSVN